MAVGLPISPILVDTYAGRVHIAWDEEGATTHSACSDLWRGMEATPFPTPTTSRLFVSSLRHRRSARAGSNRMLSRSVGTPSRPT